MDYANEVVIVTGGAAGIGRSCVELLLQKNAKVSICDVNVEVGETLTKELQQKYGANKVIFCRCNVTSDAEFEEIFRRTKAVLGEPSVLVNNAGVFDDRRWAREVDINFTSALRGTLLGMKYLRKNGLVVNMASILGLQLFPLAPVYTATKHALVVLTRCLGTEHLAGSAGVRVAALCPGFTVTSLVDGIESKALFPHLNDPINVAIGDYEFQQPEDVAKGLDYIIPRATNGSIWVVEGGSMPYEVPAPASPLRSAL